MPVTFALGDVLEPGEQTTLMSNLDAADVAALETLVTNLSKAVTRELADTILGLYSARTASDMHERRMLYLIRFYFHEKIPTEMAISQLLGMPESAATAILRNLSARHRMTLAGAYRDTLQIIFDAKIASANDEGAHHVTIVSKHLIEWLKAESSRVAPTFGPIARVRGTNDRYSIPIDTYNALCQALGVRP